MKQNDLKQEASPPQIALKKRSALRPFLRVELQEPVVIPFGIICCALANHLWIYPDPRMLVLPIVAVIFFIGMQFGPWVGFFSGGIGTLIEAVVSIHYHLQMWALWSPFQSIKYAVVDWKPIVANAAVGLIAGLYVRWFNELPKPEKLTPLLALLTTFIYPLTALPLLIFENIGYPHLFDKTFPLIIMPTLSYTWIAFGILMIINNLIYIIFSIRKAKHK